MYISYNFKKGLQESVTQKKNDASTHIINKKTQMLYERK